MTTRGEPYPPSGDPEIDRVLESLAAQRAEFEQVGRRLSETLGRGEAEDGRVAVEVRPNGSLAGLRIDPRAMRLGSDALAEAILRAAVDAEADAAAKAEAAMLTLLGGAEPPSPGTRTARDRDDAP
ncbi:YbaB/EbfC family nucleoid-associated protein [Sphaerisporangium sp. TRM90804]|uniref:YbaB/EbfC family nucleoid-associated protein n=1 Tax=Sphaerisporangium sp. TRM90804 TaxID=3031113 RepID=UPI00244B8814|nr:YbaB/EbfC family nucleoid-associated protein [Sphaerisporangium sp. TRM90804]MDH2425065.1 YbaB/EbfC family nucleoid-associated protein [Sphaerisporangium sp. TRM90804]